MACTGPPPPAWNILQALPYQAATQFSVWISVPSCLWGMTERVPCQRISPPLCAWKESDFSPVSAPCQRRLAPLSKKLFQTIPRQERVFLIKAVAPCSLPCWLPPLTFCREGCKWQSRNCECLAGNHKCRQIAKNPDHNHMTVQCFGMAGSALWAIKHPFSDHCNAGLLLNKQL